MMDPVERALTQALRRARDDRGYSQEQKEWHEAEARDHTIRSAEAAQAVIGLENALAQFGFSVPKEGD